MKKLIIIIIILFSFINCETTRVVEKTVERSKEKEIIGVKKEERDEQTEKKTYYSGKSSPPQMIRVWVNVREGVIENSRGRSGDVEGEIFFQSAKRDQYGRFIIYLWCEYYNCHYYFAAPEENKTYSIKAYRVE